MFCYIYDDIFIALKVTSICYNYQCCKTFRHNGGITSTVLTIFSKKYLLGWLISTKNPKSPKTASKRTFWNFSMVIWCYVFPRLVTVSNNIRQEYCYRKDYCSKHLWKKAVRRSNLFFTVERSSKFAFWSPMKTHFFNIIHPLHSEFLIC